MTIATTLRTLPLREAVDLVEEGGVFVDIRPVDEYLEVHVPGSISLMYEFGPGFASRARDCLPLDLRLVLLQADETNVPHAAASLRGKGFDVVGAIEGGVHAWARIYGSPGSTHVVEGNPKGGLSPAKTVILDVGDPGAGDVQEATRIPVELLWQRVEELKGNERVVVAAGYGVRAALAVGILERAGFRDIIFWKL